MSTTEAAIKNCTEIISVICRDILWFYDSVCNAMKIWKKKWFKYWIAWFSLSFYCLFLASWIWQWGLRIFLMTRFLYIFTELSFLEACFLMWFGVNIILRPTAKCIFMWVLYLSDVMKPVLLPWAFCQKRSTF